MENVEKAKKEKKEKPSRTIETMFRTTLSSHVQLSGMADKKAGLMISINSIVLSVMTSFLVNKFTEIPYLIIPTSLMVIVCLVTITFALLATKPTTRSQKNLQVPVDQSQIDPLFFGDYLTISADSYRAHMKELIADDELMYNTMLDNIYAQGRVLSKKYRMLTIAYTIFMYGFPVVILSYLITLVLYSWH
ncbi:hypothetical protein GCM10027341_42950 [Spirosoma knui]